jgi:F0F1-type ATP synthase epsilon subunit
LKRWRLPFACARTYIAGMDREYWTKALRQAETELEAARSRTEVTAAAKKLQHAKAELKALEEVPTRPAKRGRAT